MVAPAGVRLRRTWPQRLLIAFNMALIVLCLTAAGGLGYFYYKFGQLPRISLADGVLTPEPPGEPQNFLIVGSDSRAFVEPGSQDEESFGNSGLVGDARADTIILVRVDPETRRAAMVSFPRDLWLPVPPSGNKQRINTALAGGPEQLIETIKQNFNIPVHHYAQVDFKGFKGLVEAVGGVEVYLPSPVRDRLTGLNITDIGCVQLTGDQALAYVRSRNFQYQENGRWQTDQSGDFGRIKRQQDFIRRAIREALSKGLLNPSRLNRLVNVGVDNVQVSKSLDARDIVNLGKNFRSLQPDTIQQFQLPGTPVMRNGASVVVILEKDQAETQRIFDVFRGIDPAQQEVQPSGVSVRVLNGSGRAGEAGDARGALQQAQFAVADIGDAGADTTRTTIRYGSGQLAKAQLLERYLKSGAALEEFPSLQGVDVVLVTGADFAGVLVTPREAPAGPPPPPPEPTGSTVPPEPEC